ncbi:GntR family transcriptional regulator [Pelagerythrobacter rhizovicinus]|uniref:GntR family transcriptional regulator n=1 Tax=Pelagerythrobacter rhizovicinus TaxID=2268576 RepID=A0A4Q2KND8_9SPHN|nr:GntR family transcriptional regulator [Pelagerythrobacter rhizovicinus]RXZ64983.1 GntR family transcriptional regulator [Pelagerythrobacter rhizovicinus]
MPKTEPTDHFAREPGARAEPATLTVLTRVRELIVTGRIPAGSRLAAETIAKDLGVSRTPVRSALAVLTAEGLASYNVNRGYAVRDIRLRDVLDAIEARAVLEARGCGLSVDYGWALSELGLLRQAVEEGAAIVARGKWSEEIERHWYQANRDFHSLIVSVSRNAAIRNAIRMTLIYPVFGDVARLCPAVARYVPQRHRLVPETPPGHIVESQGDHEEILDAIASEEAERAERSMLTHVLKSRDRLAAIATRR